uniref:Protein-tyrosine phosphatase n=1 Tax=Anisakis simplex TaxID=6269 RepID=A0A0M3JF64_ANISI
LKKVKKAKIQATYDGKTQEVLHILYTGWPDHCPADSVAICREVRAIVMKNFDKKPIIVHCSAGVGRTGSYVAIEMCVTKLKAKETLSVAEMVKSLRDQRMGAIQNDQVGGFLRSAAGFAASDSGQISAGSIDLALDLVHLMS